MSIGVIGVGAVGLFVSYELMQMGQSVTCYVKREEQKQIIEREGIYKNDEPPVYPKVQLSSSLHAHDWLIICTKQTELGEVIAQIDQMRNEVNHVLFLQNGLGHTDKIQTLHGFRKYVGICEHGVKRMNDRHVLHTGKGQIKIAPFDHDETRDISNFNAVTFPIIVEHSLQRIMTEKLIINSVINPLTAIYGVKNGKVLTVTPLKQIAYRLVSEASKVLGLDREIMWDRVQSVCCNTSENTSSMLADINRGQPTEVDYMNGYLLQLSPEECPTHDLIYQMVKVKESLNEV